MRLRRSRQPKFSNGLRGDTAGDQLGTDVCGAGIGVDAGRCHGLEWLGCRVAFRGIVVWIDNFAVDRRIMDGAILDRDDVRRGSLRGLD